MRVRVEYSVSGLVRFISHLDLMRAFFRACLRAKLPVAVSQGYSPHLRLSFGPPLSVGMTSSREFVDIRLQKTVANDILKVKLQEGLPQGIQIEGVDVVADDIVSLTKTISCAVYLISIPQALEYNISEKVEGFLKKESIVIKRKAPKKEKLLDVRLLVKNVFFRNKYLEIHVVFSERGSVRPIEVLTCLFPEIEVEELKLWRVHRQSLD